MSDAIERYSKGRRDDAHRRALNMLDDWVDSTGFVQRNTGYYYELQGVVEDAVECGAQAVLGIRENLEGEGAAERHRHTDECLEYAAKTGKAFCIAKCADGRRTSLAREETPNETSDARSGSKSPAGQNG